MHAGWSTPQTVQREDPIISHTHTNFILYVETYLSRTLWTQSLVSFPPVLASYSTCWSKSMIRDWHSQEQCNCVWDHYCHAKLYIYFFQTCKTYQGIKGLLITEVLLHSVFLGLHPLNVNGWRGRLCLSWVWRSTSRFKTLFWYTETNTQVHYYDDLRTARLAGSHNVIVIGFWVCYQYSR